MKDKKININVGYEKLSKQEIDSHKNFAKVYESFTTTQIKPMKVAKKYTFTKIILVSTVTIAVSVSIWKYTSTKQHINKPVVSAPAPNKSTLTTNTTVKKSFIHPPLKGIDVPYKSYNIDASKGGYLAYNKSKINIPANAFCDEKGNDIKGSVTIKYREFHDAIDFFVSGIPMTYDSAGKQYNFESAGMLDIQGTQNGKPVYVKQGKNIQVAMSSFQTGTKYNVYKLDTVKKNWTYVEKSKYMVQQTGGQQPQKQDVFHGEDSVASIPLQAQTEIAIANTQLKKLETEKPVKADDDHYTLNIDADTATLPELAIFKNITFEVDPSDKEYRPDWANTDWTDAKLVKAVNGKSYVFTVSNGSVKHSILVNPVFKGKDFDNAMKVYDKKYNAYLAKIEAEKEELKKQQLVIAKKQREDSIKMAAENKRYQAITNVVSYFNVNSFGTWNSDNPLALNMGAQLAANFTDANKDNLNNDDIYLIQKDKNMVFIIHPGHNCSFEPKERNFAWAITPDNKLAIYSEDDFKKISQTSGNYTFDMKTLDNNIQNYSDVKEALKPYL